MFSSPCCEAGAGLPLGPRPRRRCPLSPTTGRGAFSLLELILVMAITAVLSAIAVPRYAASLANSHAEAAARRIVADLALAGATAYGSSKSVTVVFDIANDAVVIEGLPQLNNPQADYRTDFHQAIYQATIVSAELGGDAKVVFDMYGRPDSAGEVVIEAGGIRKNVQLDSHTAKASIQ